MDLILHIYPGFTKLSSFRKYTLLQNIYDKTFGQDRRKQNLPSSFVKLETIAISLLYYFYCQFDINKEFNYKVVALQRENLVLKPSKTCQLNWIYFF